MPELLPYAPAPPRPRGLLAWFAPDPPASVRLSDPATIEHGFFRGRVSVLTWATLGYALFYFVRKNLSVAMPVLGAELGIGKDGLGLFITLHGIIYGLSKFANGFLGDRVNARKFMAIGLILSALTNVVFGFTSIAVIMGIVWMFNGWFQGMGFPPCARLMTHWFPPKRLATMMSLWNTSHSIGAFTVLVLCGYLVEHTSWRMCFFVPAALALACAVVMLLTLPDTPASVGLPDVEGTTKAAGDAQPTDDVTDDVQSAAAFRSFVRTHVFGNKYIWIIAAANFFVYSVRYAILDWGPTFLSEAKGIKLSKAAWMVGGFELSGIVGMLLTGWITDKVFGGRGARTCMLSMVGCVGALLLLWRFPGESAWTYTGILCLGGFFVYGPQALVGISVANLATKRAAATAVGLTGIFGYASSVLSGWGLGLLVKNYGWDAGFMSMFFAGISGTILFALAWPARAHGYAEEVRG